MLVAFFLGLDALASAGRYFHQSVLTFPTFFTCRPDYQPRDRVISVAMAWRALSIFHPSNAATSGTAAQMVKARIAKPIKCAGRRESCRLDCSGKWFDVIRDLLTVTLRCPATCSEPGWTTSQARRIHLYMSYYDIPSRRIASDFFMPFGTCDRQQWERR